MANTHVENKEYEKTYELFNKLNNYINPNNEYSGDSKLLSKFLNSTEEATFYETNNNNLFKDRSVDKFDIDKTFVNLIKQAIKSKIYNININSVDITKDTEGLFKFITSREKTTTDTGTAILDHEKVKNILASLDVINTIIDVYDAYADFIKNNPEVYAIENFDNIIIVKDTDLKQGNSVSDNGNSGYFINKDAHDKAILDTDNNKPINKNVLFLSIKSFDTKFLEEYIKKHNLTNSNFVDTTDIGIDDDNSNIAPPATAGALFNTAGTLNTGSSKYIYKRNIFKKDGSSDDYKIVTKQAEADREALKINEYNSVTVDTYAKRNQVIFKEFINYMCKLQNKDKYNGIYAVLNLLRMFKVYIQLMITNCNIMFNRVFLIDADGSDLTYAHSIRYDGTVASSTHEGFVFKHITNENIKNICKANGNTIYHPSASATDAKKQYFADGSSGIDLITNTTAIGGTDTHPQSGESNKTSMLDNSYYGEALRENKKFQNEIIKTLNKLKYELSESIAILYEDIEITSSGDTGFEAKVINHNTIRIKSRNSIVDTLCVKPLTAQCGNAHIGVLDIAVNKTTDNSSFSFDKILSNLKDPDMEEAFINDNVNLISRYFHIKINNDAYEIVNMNKKEGFIEFDIRARLVYTNYDDYYNKAIEGIDAPILKIPSSNATFFISTTSNGSTTYSYKGSNKFADYNDAINSGHILFHNVTSSNKVTLSKKDAYDYNNTYISNIRSIKLLNSSINTNESKIKNYETIYNTYKSRYDFMYNQFIAYSTIIAILAVALLVGSVSSNNLATTKLITLICFGIIILIFVTYYVFNILYVNEHFTNKKKVEKFEDGTYNLINTAPFPVVTTDNKHLEFTTTDESNNFMYKKVNFVQNQLESLNDRIIQNFELLNIGIRQNDSNYAFSNLMNISTNEKNSTNKINTILDNKKVNTTTHIDLLKYEIAVYRVKINTLLYSALVIIGLITINLYTEGEYYGNLVFIGTLFGIIILTYYLTYSNHIVRTESKNFYWGKEFEASFE